MVKMKKSAIILLSVFYFVVATGFSLHIHYCGGKVKKISVLHENDEKGCCGSKEKSNGCCKEKAAFVKVNSEHKSVNEIKATSNNFTFSNFIVASTNLLHTETVSPFILFKFHPPPLIYEAPRYLKYKVLII